MHANSITMMKYKDKIVYFDFMELYHLRELLIKTISSDDPSFACVVLKIEEILAQMSVD